MRRTLAAAAAILALTIASCTPGKPSTPSTPTEPHVTLRVPETVVSRGTAQLVIDSQGHNNQTVQLYVFHENFGKPSTCSDTSVRPIAVELRGGPQQVTIDTGQPGDLWLVMTGDSFQTKCGESRTRALINPVPELAPACINTPGLGVSCPKTWPVFKAGQEAKYNLSAAVPPEGGLHVRVQWIGPFETAPEAQAAPCPTTPVAFTDEVELVYDAASPGANSNGDNAASKNVTRVVQRGVYRLLFEVKATEFTAAAAVSCEKAPLVAVQ